jgi:PAS domain S-box-containing protein
MTQRRKIAIAYVLAVPVVLAIVLFQHAALFGVKAFEGEMVQAVEVIREAEAASSLLADAVAEAREFTNSMGDGAYQSTILQLRGVLNQLHEHAANDPSVKAKCQALEPLVESQITLFQRAIDSAKKEGTSIRGRDLPAGDMPNLMRSIANILGDIQTAEQIRLEQQGEAATRSMHLANTFTTYGGGLLVWLIGVAAFLLFHDEKARAWAGVERRVHTKVLEVFPLGVSVTTDAGIILYANPAEEALFEYRAGELLGGNANLLHALDEEEGKHTVSEILERLGLNKVWSGHLPIRKKDGTILKTASWIVNMEIPGKVYRVFVHNTD